MPAADFLTAEQITSYVNSALFNLFNAIWEQAAGDMEVFAKVLPEMVVQRTVTLTEQADFAIYNIATPNLDFVELLEASGDNNYGVVGKKHLFQAIKTGQVLQYTGTTAKPIFINNEDSIYCFPNKVASGDLTIVKQPLDPTTGNLIVQNNSTADSPYRSHWESKLAELAYQEYLTDSQMQS